MDLVFECRRVVFEWEGFGLESFQNDTSLSPYIHMYIYIYVSKYVCVCIYRYNLLGSVLKPKVVGTLW